MDLIRRESGGSLSPRESQLLGSARRRLARAEDLELVATTLGLTDLVSSLDGEWRPSTVARAHLLLLSDRTDDALRALARTASAASMTTRR